MAERGDRPTIFRGTLMTETSGQVNGNRELRQLADPDFFAHWAAIRNRMALTPEDSPERPEIKRSYNAVLTEYRRRMDGGIELAG
jgi:hypothetical protein